jgi:hypothetical protein
MGAAVKHEVTVTVTALIETFTPRRQRAARNHGQPDCEHMGQSRPGGAVQLAVNGVSAGEPVTVDAKGRASWETSRLKAGANRVTASSLPGADSGFLPSTSLEKLHEVNRCGCDRDKQQ